MTGFHPELTYSLGTKRQLFSTTAGRSRTPSPRCRASPPPGTREQEQRADQAGKVLAQARLVG